MSFFRDFTLSPRERRQKQKSAALDRRYEIERLSNLKILPEIRTASLELLKLSNATNENWLKTLNALRNFKDVALKSNSPEDLVIAANAHSLCLLKYISSRNFDSNLLSFDNLKVNWWQAFDDLEKIYLAGKFLNLNPMVFEDVIECLNLIDDEITNVGCLLDGYGKWVEERNYAARSYPAVRIIEV